MRSQLLTAADIRQVAMFYPFDPAESSFNCTDANLNAIWNLCHYTMQAAPFCGIYIDGVRERMPYEADCYIEQLGHYCCDREFAIQRYSASYLFHHATWPTEWNLLCPLIAHADYIATGDTALLCRDYDLLKAKLLLPLAREDGLISTKTGKQTLSLFKSIDFDGKQLRDLVDWPQPGETDGYVFTEYNTVVNAIHYAALVKMSDIAGALGKNDDAQAFAWRARNREEIRSTKPSSTRPAEFTSTAKARHTRVCMPMRSPSRSDWSRWSMSRQSRPSSNRER